MAAGIGVGQEMDRQVVDEFVKANWLGIAGVAWRAHLQLGRGVVLFDPAVLEQWREGRPVGLDVVMYLAMGEAALGGVYDPAMDVIVGFTSAGYPLHRYRSEALERPLPLPDPCPDVLHTWLYRLEPPPPEAHRRTSQ